VELTSCRAAVGKYIRTYPNQQSLEINFAIEGPFGYLARITLTRGLGPRAARSLPRICVPRLGFYHLRSRLVLYFTISSSQLTGWFRQRRDSMMTSYYPSSSYKAPVRQEGFHLPSPAPSNGNNPPSPPQNFDINNQLLHASAVIRSLPQIQR